MPRPEDIEKFTQVLNSLGDEPAIREARSETIEQVSAPGAETPEPEGEPLDSLPLDSLPMEEEGPPGDAGLQDVLGGLSELTEEPDLGAEIGRAHV